MTKPLLILPFDHRSSFSKNILGLEGKLNNQQQKEISNLKEIIFESFLKVQKKYHYRDYFGILVDEEYGSEIIKKAKKSKAKICLPVEKSGQAELQFAYGRSFGQHITKFKPDYVKVLVRYNPLNKEVNKKQLQKLKELNKFCRKNNYQIILELLVPSTNRDLKIAKTENNYNRQLRLKRTLGAIKEIKKVIQISIWKLEGFDKIGWSKIIKATNQKSKIIFLGRGEEKALVAKWLKAALPYKEIIGFAIGRTVFLEPLKQYAAGKINKEYAVKKIADNFNYFVRLWAQSRSLEL